MSHHEPLRFVKSKNVWTDNPGGAWPVRDQPFVLFNEHRFYVGSVKSGRRHAVPANPRMTWIVAPDVSHLAGEDRGRTDLLNQAAAFLKRCRFDQVSFHTRREAARALHAAMTSCDWGDDERL